MPAQTKNTEAKTPKTKTPKWDALTREQAEAVAKTARPAQNPCLCGCGGLTKSRFFPGHDALLKEKLRATTERGTDEAKTAANEALAAFGW